MDRSERRVLALRDFLLLDDLGQLGGSPYGLAVVLPGMKRSKPFTVHAIKRKNKFHDFILVYG